MSVDSSDISKNEELSQGLQAFLSENGFSSLDLNQYNVAGETPLTLAISTNNNFAIHDLIFRVDLNKPNLSGKRPLDLARDLESPAEHTIRWSSRQGKLSIGLEEFLKLNGFSSLDLNQYNDKGETPLTLAIKTDNSIVVNELTRKFADLDKSNQSGESPLELARDLKSSAERQLMEAREGGDAYIGTHELLFAEIYNRIREELSRDSVEPINEDNEINELFTEFCSQLKAKKPLAEVNKIYQLILQKNSLYFSEILPANTILYKDYLSILGNYIQSKKWEGEEYIKQLNWNLNHILNHTKDLPLLKHFLSLARASNNIPAHQVISDHIKLIYKASKEKKEEQEVERVEERKETIEKEMQKEREVKKELEHEQKNEIEKKEIHEQEIAFPKLEIGLFSAIQNDAHISGSQFEGQTEKMVNSFYRDFLKYLIQHKDSIVLINTNRDKILPKLEKVCASVENMSEFILALENAKNEGYSRIGELMSPAPNYDKRIKQIDGELQKVCDKVAKEQIENIKNELKKKKGSVLLPCGWLGAKDSPGHAMLLNIEKTSDDAYKITIFNTGDGLENHPKKVVGNKVKYSPTRVFDGINSQALQGIIKDLVVEPQLKPYWEGSYPNSDSNAAGNFSKDYLYGKIEALEKYEKQVDPRTLVYKTPQWSGTCTSSVYKAYFKHELGRDYAGFKANLQYRVNKEFIGSDLPQGQDSKAAIERVVLDHSASAGPREQTISTPVSSDEILKQIHFSLENFSRMLGKRELDKRIPEEVLQRYYQELLNMAKEMRDFSSQIEKVDKQTFEITALRDTPEIELRKAPARDVEALFSKAPIEVSRHFESPEFKSAGELISTINDFSKQISDLYHEGRFPEIKRLVESRFFNCIPIPEFKFENNSQALKFNLNLNALHKMYLVSCKQSDHHGTSELSAAISSVISIISAKALERGNRDLFQCSTAGRESIRERYIENLRRFESYLKSPLFLVHNPDLQNKINQLKKSVPAFLSEFSPPQKHMMEYVKKYYPTLEKITYGYANRTLKSGARHYGNYQDLVYKLMMKDIVNGSESALEEVGVPSSEQPLLDKELKLFKEDLNLKQLAEDNQIYNSEVLDNQYSEINFEDVYQLEGLYTTDEVSEYNKIFDNKIFSESEKYRKWRKIDPPDRSSNRQARPLEHRYMDVGMGMGIGERPFYERALISEPMTENQLQVQKRNSSEDIEICKLQHLRVDKRNQVFSTIEYYSNNISKLEVDNLHENDRGLMHQLILHCNIFEPGVLVQELEQNPLLKSNLVKFIKEGIRLFTHDGAASFEAAFFYEQAIFLRNFIPEFDDILKDIGDNVKKFEVLREKWLLTDKQKITYARLLKVETLHLLKKLTKDPSLAKNKEFINRLYISRATIKSLELELPILNKFSKALDNLLNDEFSTNREVILNADYDVKTVVSEILRCNYPTLIEGMKETDFNQIKGQHPVYTIESSGIQINLEVGFGHD